MDYKVIVFFRDKLDSNFVYHVGDIYPRHGYTPTDERIKALSSKNNRRGIALIKKAASRKKKVVNDAN